MQTQPTPTDHPATAAEHGLFTRWRQHWEHSLRFRLLAMGLMPLLVAFPLVLAVLFAVGGERANALVRSNLRSSLAGADNYLHQVRSNAGVRVAQLAKSERLLQRLSRGADPQELDDALRVAAENSGLDFLIVAHADGRVLGSSSGVERGRKLPDSYVVRQARIGVANAAFERFDAKQLQAFSRAFAYDAPVEPEPAAAHEGAAQASGLLINAAAHFPLAVDGPDLLLLGGILVNRNYTLIEHMREVLFPVGSLPGNVEGLTAIHLDRVSVATSRQRLQGHGRVGRAVPEAVIAAVLDRGETWTGPMTIDAQSYVMGFAPLTDGNGRRIGMLAAGFPDGPYQRSIWLLLGTIAGLLALTMLAISLVFLRGGRELTQRLAHIVGTMTAVRQGERDARVGTPARDDELGRLAQHFDELLETIAAHDAAQRTAQQTIADEASRRRALFEHERDGVLVLNADGSVFEANPKGAAMLGYDPDELAQLRIADWDPSRDAARWQATLAAVGAEGHFMETVHRRKDGSTYAAEVSLSRATWADRTFVFVLMRDITERKAVESELGRYRLQLEQLVEQRTRELHERNEQLDAIFALSPDGFVSFDPQRRVAFANQSFLQMTGLTAHEVIGLDEAVFSARLSAQSLPAQVFPGVATLRDGQRRTDDAEAAPWRHLFELALPRRRVLEVALRQSESDKVSQVLYLRDVTHETEVDRMKSEFLTTAAHELRTPMTSIYGFANLLRMREMSADKRRDIVGTIARQSELMITILNQLLDLARIEARQGQDFQLEPLALQALVSQTISGFGVPAGREPPRVTAIDPRLRVHADRTKLQQALLNVVSNAYKYSPKGGEVSLRCRSEQHDGTHWAAMEVRDRGIGMTEEQLGHVCERFYRADASGNIPGTGLGMAIVSDIVKLHRGRLHIASAVGQGTTVTLWLPAHDTSSAEADRSECAAAA